MPGEWEQMGPGDPGTGRTSRGRGGTHTPAPAAEGAGHTQSLLRSSRAAGTGAAPGGAWDTPQPEVGPGSRTPGPDAGRSRLRCSRHGPGGAGPGPAVQGGVAVGLGGAGAGWGRVPIVTDDTHSLPIPEPSRYQHSLPGRAGGLTN